MGDGGMAQHDLVIPPGLRWALGGLSAAVVGLFALALAHQWQADFEVYRTGGQHVLGTGLYAAQVKAVDRVLLFTYTPLAALAFWPFSFLSPWAGQIVWGVVNIAALAALVAVSAAAARRRPVQRADWQLALIALAPVSLLIWPVRYGFELGQINVVLVLMIVADLSMESLPAGEAAAPGSARRRGGGDQAHPARLHLVPARHPAVGGSQKRRPHVLCGHRGDVCPRPRCFVELLHQVRLRRPAHRRRLQHRQPDPPGGSGANGHADPAPGRRRRAGGRSLCRVGARRVGVPAIVGAARDAAVRRHRTAGLADLVAAPLRVVRAVARLAGLRGRWAAPRSGSGPP